MYYFLNCKKKTCLDLRLLIIEKLDEIKKIFDSVKFSLKMVLKVLEKKCLR